MEVHERAEHLVVAGGGGAEAGGGHLDEAVGSVAGLAEASTQWWKSVRATVHPGSRTAATA